MGGSSSSSSSSVCSPRFLVARFKLFSQSCCAALVTVLVRWAVGSFPFVDQTVLTTFVAASIFVLSILVGGVMQDFKDGEKIPGDVASAFFAMLSQVVAHGRTRASPLARRAETQAALRALAAWLLAVARLVDSAAGGDGSGSGSDETAAATLACHVAQTDLMACSISAGSWNTAFANWGLVVAARLSRMRVIRGTDFYLPAYTLFDSLTAAVFCLLLITDHRLARQESAFLITGVIAFLFFYLANFARAIDNPFVYSEHVHSRTVEGAFRASGAGGLLRGLLAQRGRRGGGGDGEARVRLTTTTTAVVVPSSPPPPASLENATMKNVTEGARLGSQRFLDVAAGTVQASRESSQSLNSIQWDELFVVFTACLVEAVEAVEGANQEGSEATGGATA
jgi:hypothetical protein